MDMVGCMNTYTYAVLFFGMMIFGETVFLPASYLSLQGVLDPVAVIVVSVVATLVADFVWYLLGSKVSLEKIQHWRRIKKNRHTFEKISALFDDYGYYVLFISKFVYGTRILVQLLSGIKKLPVVMYLIINTIGTFTFLMFLFCITFFVDSAFATVTMHNFYIGIISVLIIGVVINLCIHAIIRKKMSL